MSGSSGTWLEAFDEALLVWTDERHVSKDILRSVVLFGTYLTNFGDSQGWQYDGHSWKEATPLGVLVVKGTMGESKVVSFTSARSFLNAVKIFVRKCEDDRVEWVNDRFRG